MNMCILLWQQAAALTGFGFDVLPPNTPPPLPPGPQTGFPPPAPAQRVTLTLTQLNVSEPVNRTSSIE